MKDRLVACLPSFLKALSVFYVLALIAIVWIFLPSGDDLPFHLQRLDALSREFRMGVNWENFPFRIYSSTLDGYGYGSPLFYGDLFLYPFALLVSWGMPLLMAFQSLLTVMLVSSFFSLRFLFREITTNRQGFGAAFGLFYCIASTTLYGEIVGSCVGRGTCWVFVPLAIAGFYRIVFTERERGWIPLAAGAAGTLLSHPLNIALLLVILLVMLFASIRYVDKSALVQIAIAAGASISTTLWYTIPLLEQVLSQGFFVTTSVAYNGKMVMSDFLVPLEGIVFPSQLRDRFLEWLGMSAQGDLYKAGMIVALVALVVVGIRQWRERGKRWNSFCTSLVFITLFVLWIQTPLFPYEAIGGALNILQFPWRLYIFVELCIGMLLAITFDGTFADSILGAQGADHVNQSALYKSTFRSVFTVVFVVVIMSFMSSGFGLYREMRGNLIDGSLIPASDRIFFSSLDIGTGEYVPASTVNRDSPFYRADDGWFFIGEYLVDRGCIAVSARSGAKLAAHRKGRDTYVSYSGLKEGDVISVPLLWYKGYAAMDIGTGEELDVSGGDAGFVEVVARESLGTVRVWYAGTAVQHISTIVSVFAMVVMIVLGIVYRVQKR